MVNARKSMVLEIFQLSISDETHLKRLKRLEIYWKFPVAWSFYLHSRSLFPVKFPDTESRTRAVRCPKEFPEIYVKANVRYPSGIGGLYFVSKKYRNGRENENLIPTGWFASRSNTLCILRGVCVYFPSRDWTCDPGAAEGGS